MPPLAIFFTKYFYVASCKLSGSPVSGAGGDSVCGTVLAAWT